MSNYSKPNTLSITFILFLIVALIGAMFLVGRRQETRRGAYFSGASLLILPDSITANVGDDVPVQLWVKTENDAKVTSVDTKICYGSGLILDSADVSSLVDLNTEAFRLKAMIKNVNGCLRLAIGSGDIETANLKSGLVRVASIRFKAAVAGSGNLEINLSESTVGGYNPVPGASDVSMRISEVTGADYVIGEAGSLSPTPTSRINIKYEKVDCDAATGRYNCTENDNGTFDSLEECQQTAGCEIAGGDFPVLRFKMAFLGVMANAGCADGGKMPLTVTVRAADGTFKIYPSVIPTKLTGQDGSGIYQVSLKLDGFNYKDNIAVFIKGPKHLQVKYGINNQDKYYDKAGGELMGLTKDENTTPLFSFEKYPLLAGDVTGPDGVQDGQVDGLDFSVVKTEAGKRTSVETGGYLLTDLNGNCQMESQDLALLMLSLSVRQGQMY